MKLQNKIAIVTGASSGMGRAITALFVQEGATVIAVARRRERLEELSTSLVGSAGKVVPFVGDTTSLADIDAAVDLAVKDYGRLDIVVNNAGIMDDMMPAAEVTDELWERVLAVNTTAVMRMTRRALKEMLAAGQGVFVNTASVAGLNAGRGGTAYTASKFAVVGITKNVAFQYATKGIRCNAICPGDVDTEIGAVGMKNLSPFGFERGTSGVANCPRRGSAEEIAKIALFLASDDAGFVNGATIVADAGWTAY
jgi:NAD(P)-dependent dehydrogenase (short-subunit alcohol dehydrogenase family)